MKRPDMFMYKIKCKKKKNNEHDDKRVNDKE